MCKIQTHGGSFVLDPLGICSAQSSCKYELKNGLSVIGDVLWTCITGKLRSYSSQPTFTSIHRKTPLSSSIYSTSRQGHACNPRP
ncbi:hypothetical protein BYT27DRAFT_7205173 [Phlegmacium glaucopus]|nr:hypothetical protein BYT27DRAFT_7205173 [Phlegmacium glaucopus]